MAHAATAILTILASGFTLTLAAQQVAGVGTAPVGTGVSTFAKTPAGDWRTTIKAADGTEREFLYTPSTKINPSIDTSLSWRGEEGIGYQIAIGNAADAPQEVSWVWIGIAQPVAVTAVPAAWTHLTPQRPGVASFVGPLGGDDIPNGIRPGATGSFEMQARVLPGVVTIKAAGNTALAVNVPEGLSETQRADLERLSSVATVDRPAIGPALSAGIMQPELTLSVVLARVRGHYTAELQRYRHPHATELAGLLGALASENASLEDGVTRKGLLAVREVARRSVSDRWHQQLSQALAMCADALLSGIVPWRG